MRFLTSNKVYAHIDCNSFFASCEVIRNPSLKGKCVCVGGEIIVAASYEAKKFGIKTGTPVWEAKRMLGNKGIFILPDLNFYKTISKRFTDFISDYANSIEIFSIDEAFVDITGIDTLYKMDYFDFAVFLKKEIRKCIGINVSIGVSNTRIRAKIFSDIYKPFGELVAFDEEDISDIFSGLKVTDTPFIGRKSGEKLQYISKTIESFRKLSFWKVDEILGKNGTDLWLELNAVDVMNFKGNPLPKSISRTRSFNKCVTNDKDYLWNQILTNFNSAFHILNKYNLELKSIAIYMRDKNFGRYSFDLVLSEHTNIFGELLRALRNIFQSKIPFDIKYRSTGVIFYDFREIVPKQLSILDIDNEKFNKNKKLIDAMESMNKRYAMKIVNFGTD